MPINQNSVLRFQESTNPDLIHYELEVFNQGLPLGSPQIISLDDDVDGFNEVAGEIEIQLKNVTELPSDANGIYSFHIYSVDSLGRSATPLEIGPLTIEYELIRKGPTTQDKRGVLLPNSVSPFYASTHPAGDRP